MWAYLLFIPRTEFDDGGDAELTRTRAAALHTHPGTNAQPGGVPPLFTYVGKKRVWVLVKADLTDAQAETISNNDCLLTGTVKLIWWESIMSADFRRTLDENDKQPEFKVCKIDLKGPLKGKEADLLAMVAESMPNGPDKDRLLEAIARNAHSSDRALAELEELASLLVKADHPVCEDETNERTLAFFVEKVESMPDGPDKDRLLEILRGNKETKH